MLSSAKKSPPASSLLRTFLSSFSANWILALLELYPHVAQLLSEKYAGLYEILKYDVTLELLDPKGKTGVFRKHQQVRFLQNNVIAFEDYAWGEGQIFEKYTVRPGMEVDRYQEGDRWNVLISLRETKNKGEVEDFFIDREVKNGFTDSEEWQQVEIRHHTRSLRISVIFPKERHCQRAILIERSQHTTIELRHGHFHDLPDRRQLVSWSTQDVPRFEVYTLRWWW